MQPWLASAAVAREAAGHQVHNLCRSVSSCMTPLVSQGSEAGVHVGALDCCPMEATEVKTP